MPDDVTNKRTERARETRSVAGHTGTDHVPLSNMTHIPRTGSGNSEGVGRARQTYSERDISKVSIQAPDDAGRLVRTRPSHHRRRALNILDHLGQCLEDGQPAVRILDECVVAKQLCKLVGRELQNETGSRRRGRAPRTHAVEGVEVLHEGSYSDGSGSSTSGQSKHIIRLSSEPSFRCDCLQEMGRLDCFGSTDCVDVCCGSSCRPPHVAQQCVGSRERPRRFGQSATKD